ncbi:hypothetical protein LJC46_03310 [Desulfovibrio sp. OttesenSCG-928-G15]|nr:hypothetical protein [Desulfovibrio sp. OttesenSCG-928-G15]
MPIKIQSRPIGDNEARAGEIYRYFRDSNMLFMGRDKKMEKGKLLRLAEEKALKDIESLMRRSGQ